MTNKNRIKFYAGILSFMLFIALLLQGFAIGAEESTSGTVYGDNESNIIDVTYPEITEPTPVVNDIVYDITVPDAVYTEVYFNGKIAVTRRYWDDIAKILDDLSKDYTELNENKVQDITKIQDFDVVFINNSGTSFRNSTSAAESLRQFVQNGGILFVTDYAAAFASEAFPGYLYFANNSKIGREGGTIANIVDENLAQGLDTIDDKARLQYKLQSWLVLDKVSKDVNVLLDGSYKIYRGNHSSKPLAVSFNYGQGKVIYTTFTLIDQDRELAKDLIINLVFRN